MERIGGANTPTCAYRRMWAELRSMLDEDRHSVPARSTPAGRAANRSRRYHAERLLALMDHLEFDGCAR
jgi:hypothetical protein